MIPAFLLPPAEIPPSCLARMRLKPSGGEWFAYQNHDPDHPLLGSLAFLFCGPEAVHKEPPCRLPDGPCYRLGRACLLVGRVDLGAAVVLPLFPA